jgi:ABC-type phosphate/phosphonate transport system substrate-binding protein
MNASSTTPLRFNTRMYDVTPSAKRAWQNILKWVSKHSGVAMALIEHEPPKLLSDLWLRGDLAAVMMCGLPLALRTETPQVLAQCVPIAPRYKNQAVYCTDIVVAADSPFQTLSDTFGYRAGYTLKDSQSGYYAFRHHLLTQYATTAQPYQHITGNLMNARGVIQAIARGEIDVGPLDGYVHDLIRHTDPAFAQQVRVVESTQPTPMPAIVSTASLDLGDLKKLRYAFASVTQAHELAEERDTLLIAGFIEPAIGIYAPLLQRARQVDEANEWP